MTFKQFVQWCNKRACDGCWGQIDAAQCIEVIRDVREYPFWKREKMWKHHHMHGWVIETVEKINREIGEYPVLPVIPGPREDNHNITELCFLNGKEAGRWEVKAKILEKLMEQRTNVKGVCHAQLVEFIKFVEGL